MSADVVQSTCNDNTSCSFRPGQCSIIDIAPFGYTANYVCGYSDGKYTYLCNPGCCPGGVAPGFCKEDKQPPPTCTDSASCDGEYASKPCKPYKLLDGRTACGYIQTVNDPENGYIEMFFFCNPGCGKCKGTYSVGPCPGDSTDFTKVSFNNKRPTDNQWVPIPAKEVQEPIVNRYFYAVIVLLIALALAGTLALV